MPIQNTTSRNPVRSRRPNLDRQRRTRGANRRPLGPDHQQADDQQPGIPVLGLFQQLRPEHHRLHHLDAPSHGAAHPAAAEDDQGHERACAQGPGDQRKVQGRLAASFSRDDEALPRVGRQPRRLPWPACPPDAHLHRPLLGLALDPGIDAREPRRPCHQALPLASRRRGVHSHRPLLPRPKSWRPDLGERFRPVPCPDSRRFDVAHAEDEHVQGNQSAAGTDEQDAPVVHAHYDRRVLPAIRDGTYHILDRLQRSRNHRAGIHRRMGSGQGGFLLRFPHRSLGQAPGGTGKIRLSIIDKEERRQDLGRHDRRRRGLRVRLPFRGGSIR